MINMRAYKVCFPDGSHDFESGLYDEGPRTLYESICELAMGVKHEIDQHPQKRTSSSISIDLVPFHDIEHHMGSEPTFCEKLSKKQKKEFWEHFTGVYKQKRIDPPRNAKCW